MKKLIKTLSMQAMEGSVRQWVTDEKKYRLGDGMDYDSLLRTNTSLRIRVVTLKNYIDDKPSEAYLPVIYKKVETLCKELLKSNEAVKLALARMDDLTIPTPVDIGLREVILDDLSRIIAIADHSNKSPILRVKQSHEDDIISAAVKQRDLFTTIMDRAESLMMYTACHPEYDILTLIQTKAITEFNRYCVLTGILPISQWLDNTSLST